jgi:hypothetical protein
MMLVHSLLNCQNDTQRQWGRMTKAAAAAAVGKDVRGSGNLILYGVVVKRISLCIFSILIFGEEAVCLDGVFVPAIFQESGFYLNSLR